VLRTLRRQERNVLRLLVRVDDPRVLDALLPAIQRNISGISNVLGWQACDHALALFERLPDEPAARCLVRQPEPLHIALRCCDSSPECVHRALRLIALLRRTDSVGSLTCLRELQTLPLAAQGIAPRVIEAAAECAAYLRRIADERRRNALLLRPASAPTDALLRPASAPQGDTDLLLRPRGQEDAP
jgi:hypothetical protein